MAGSSSSIRSSSGSLTLLFSSSAWLPSCAVAWLLGALAAAFLSFSSTLWLVLAGSAFLFMLIMLFRRRPRAAHTWGLLVLSLLAALWTDLHLHRLPSDHVQRFLTDPPQLVELEGRIVDVPRLIPPSTGAFASFIFWMSPQTLFTLDCRAIHLPQGWQPLSGRLLVYLDQADPRLLPGQSLRLLGFLAPFAEPANPGQEAFLPFHDFRIAGRLFVKDPASIQILSSHSWAALASLRAFLFELHRSARDALTLGLERSPPVLALLQALVLGQTSPQLTALRPAFQHLGVAHVLAISGLHLAILLAFFWSLFSFCLYPPRAALLTLLVLLAYLLLLPPRVPVLRASLMTGLFLLSWALARRPRSLDLLSLAFLILLIWRPMDLWDPGFQLSFSVTAALLIFTFPLLRRWGLSWELDPAFADRTLLPPYLVSSSCRSLFLLRLRSYGLTALAVNLIGFLASLPLVAWHFHQISPLAVFWSFLILPLVSLILFLGFIKLFLGLLIPDLSWALAYLLAPLTDLLIRLTHAAARLPGSVVLLHQPPSLLWVLAVAAVALAWLAGYFIRRRIALLAAVLLLLLWLLWHQSFSWWDRCSGNPLPPGRTLLRLHILSVGDGNAQLLVIPSHRRPLQFRSSSDDFVLLFDCGSRDRPDLGARIVAPALARLGIRRIHLAMISHPDLDHFSGFLDLADRIPIDRVLISPQFLDHAQQHPRSTAAFLLTALAHRRIPCHTVSAGWSLQQGPVRLTLLWPPSGRSFSSTNDASFVLRLDAASRRFLLTADIQQEAMEALLATGADLHADVTDLPHHGSFVPASSSFLAAVSPRLVVQSSTATRLHRDRWAALLHQHNIPRLVTAQTGMISLVLDPFGTLYCSTYRPQPHALLVFPRSER